MAILLKLTKPELIFLQDTLDSARAELAELMKEEDWYVTDLDERCLAAFNIVKYAIKTEVTDSATEE